MLEHPAGRTRLHCRHQGGAPGRRLTEIRQTLLAQQRQVGGGGGGRGVARRQAVPAAQRCGGYCTLETWQAAYAQEGEKR